LFECCFVTVIDCIDCIHFYHLVFYRCLSLQLRSDSCSILETFNIDWFDWFEMHPWHWSLCVSECSISRLRWSIWVGTCMTTRLWTVLRTVQRPSLTSLPFRIPRRFIGWHSPAILIQNISTCLSSLERLIPLCLVRCWLTLQDIWTVHFRRQGSRFYCI